MRADADVQRRRVHHADDVRPVELHRLLRRQHVRRGRRERRVRLRRPRVYELRDGRDVPGQRVHDEDDVRRLELQGVLRGQQLLPGERRLRLRVGGRDLRGLLQGHAVHRRRVQAERDVRRDELCRMLRGQHVRGRHEHGDVRQGRREVWSCAIGSTCIGGFCEATCGPTTCPNGCCVNGACAVGKQDTACGVKGASCTDCTAEGEVCSGQACVAPPCSSQNCNGCCDKNGKCQTGTSNTVCGADGASCADCTPSKDVCTNQACVPTCGPSNCAAGCCDAQGACEAGFLDSACGSEGATCTNCTAEGSTCDVVLTPRVCKSDQTTCPAPFPSCPSGTTTSAPKVQTVCSAQDLSEAAAACASGAASAGCRAFFTSEKQLNAACASCLAPFDVPFAQETGIFLCVAPYVSASCDQSTGCFDLCEQTSCSQCPTGSVATCKRQAQNGACRGYVSGTTCVLGGLTGQGSFCSPTGYASFGDWLRGVGGHYCGG